MRRTFLAAPVVAVVLACAACGGSSQQDLSQWADKMCAVLAGPQYPQWSAAMTTLASGTANLPPAEAKMRISTALAAAASYDNAVADALDKSGTPNLANAGPLIKDAALNLRTTAQAFTAEQAKVDALSTTDQMAFSTSLSGIAGDIGQIGTAGTNAFNSIETGTLGQALNNSPKCASVTAPPVAPSIAGATTPPAASPGGTLPPGTAVPSATGAAPTAGGMPAPAASPTGAASAALAG